MSSKITVQDNINRFNALSERVRLANEKLLERKTRAQMTREEEMRLAEEVRELGFGDGSYEGLIEYVKKVNDEFTKESDILIAKLEKLEQALKISEA